MILLVDWNIDDVSAFFHHAGLPIPKFHERNYVLSDIEIVQNIKIRLKNSQNIDCLSYHQYTY